MHTNRERRGGGEFNAFLLCSYFNFRFQDLKTWYPTLIVNDRWLATALVHAFATFFALRKQSFFCSVVGVKNLNRESCFEYDNRAMHEKALLLMHSTGRVLDCEVQFQSRYVICCNSRLFTHSSTWSTCKRYRMNLVFKITITLKK
jgi:hypothetical protein